MMSDQASSNTSVDLATITTVVSSLQRVVADFYGPQCTQTLLTSQTGKAVVTSDGFSILQALQPDHPVAQVVFKALKRYHSVTLDGCKTFLIYLANFLVHLQEEINLGKFYHNGTNVSSSKHDLEKQGTICARKYVRQMKQNVLPILFDKLRLNSDTLANKMLKEMDMTDVLKHILQTSLMPHYNPKLCDHFADLLISILPNECWDKSFAQIMQFLVDNFFDINIKVPGTPYGECSQVDPFLLNRDFALRCDNLLSLSQVSMVILKGNIDGGDLEEESQECFLVKQTGQMINYIHHRRKVVERFAHTCASKQIDLIICTQAIPGYVIDVFRQRNISVIANVAEKDADLLEILTGKLPFSNVSDGIEIQNVIHLTGICELIVGGKKYVQLKVSNISYPVKHLIVCAPTIGLCDQLAVALQKALNSVGMCYVQGVIQGVKNNDKNFTENHDTEELDKDLEKDLEESDCLSKSFKQENVDPNVKIVESSVTDLSEMFANLGIPSTGQNDKLCIVEGGGSFEILVMKVLHDLYDSCTDSNLSLMCKILERTMISLVKKLFQNTSCCRSQSQSTRGFIEVKTVLDEKVSCGKLWGLNRRGMPCNMSDKGIIEPLMCKIHMLYCVLNLAEQLLGIDEIVSVRKIENEEAV
ncbi:Bardet-Biedl syndrome 10 protein homolog [Mercenaria mercenaria]|uniref:Bardet-Biedl syndrome 10 protein homolog n=1 Tax=Mercenaria mercenaria TaxID=6596 RepID=UPI00234ECC77|nr:Bardet-Biedl syndrome 10 protein homolog [Mercenaria mercenaria]XP_053401002.1 Bardet-Biedl syndrome 10 protein homolog [Mercenaria mercenaria]